MYDPSALFLSYLSIVQFPLRQTLSHPKKIWSFPEATVEFAEKVVGMEIVD